MSTPAGKMAFTVAGAVAELERSLTVERVKGGLRNAKAKGCKVTGLPSGVSSHEMDYLFGPRFYVPTHGRVFPFVQVLFGGERFSAGVTGVGSASSSAFAIAAGGGADVTLSKHVSLRAIQFDYLYTHFGGASQNNLRLQSGIVWRFGR